MKRMAAIAITLSMMTACSPSTEPAPPPSVVQPADERAAIVAAVTPVVAANLGQPVLFEPETLNTQDGWAWIVGTPRTPAGGPIDWGTTPHASRKQEGAMDDSGAIYLLAQKTAEGWSVREYVVAPTDMAWLDWPQKYGAPPELFQTAR